MSLIFEVFLYQPPTGFVKQYPEIIDKPCDYDLFPIKDNVYLQCLLDVLVPTGYFKILSSKLGYLPSKTSDVDRYI